MFCADSGVWCLQDGTAQAQTDLVLNLEEGAELTGGIEYATELFLPATADRMARHFEVCAFLGPCTRRCFGGITPVVHALTDSMVLSCDATGVAGKHRSRAELCAGGAEHHAS